MCSTADKALHQKTRPVARRQSPTTPVQPTYGPPSPQGPRADCQDRDRTGRPEVIDHPSEPRLLGAAPMGLSAAVGHQPFAHQWHSTRQTLNSSLDSPPTGTAVSPTTPPVEPMKHRQSPFKFQPWPAPSSLRVTIAVRMATKALVGSGSQPALKYPFRGSQQSGPATEASHPYFVCEPTIKISMDLLRGTHQSPHTHSISDTRHAGRRPVAVVQAGVKTSHRHPLTGDPASVPSTSIINSNAHALTVECRIMRMCGLRWLVRA